MKNNKSIQDLRQDYSQSILEVSDLDKNPMKQFELWWENAIEAEILEPNAMTLATVNANGIPSARIVLLKELRKKGFVFYTNYKSQKAQDIKKNKNVALVFLWKELQRQVRIQGVIKKISEADSLKYAQTRPIKSQMGAWVSQQSKVIKNREKLEKKMEHLIEEYGDQDAMPKPPYWGGYIVKPTAIEFWQGRRSRLHDRLRYSKSKKGWAVERLSP